MKDSSLEGVAQFGGTHYKGMAIEPAEFIHKNGIGFLAGEAIVYLARHHVKNGPEDLLKAIHFCVMLLSMQYGLKIRMEDVLLLVAGAQTGTEQASVLAAKVRAQIGGSPAPPWLVDHRVVADMVVAMSEIRQELLKYRGAAAAERLDKALKPFIDSVNRCPLPTSQEPASSLTNV